MNAPVIHDVDTTKDRVITDDDLGVWLLYFLEGNGAGVTLSDDDSVRVNLNPLGIDRETAHRWAPIITALIPRFRELLLARPRGALHTRH